MKTEPLQLITPKQAASIVGCSPQQIRYLIRKNILRATKVATDCNQHGYRYSIFAHEAERYAKQPQATGFPRGQKRQPKNKENQK